MYVRHPPPSSRLTEQQPTMSDEAWSGGFKDDISDIGELEVENDPGVERVGSAETWRVCEAHWKQLTAARVPKELVLSEDEKQDRHLYHTFRSQFGLDVSHVSWADLHNQFEMGKWRAVLSACEGRVKWYNMMYLLRADVKKSYSEQKDDMGPPDDTGVCHPDGLLLVPRIQWLMVEIARNREGLNDGLHMHGQTASVKQIKKEIEEACDAEGEEDNAPMLLSLLTSLAAHPVLPEAVLKKTRIGRLLTQKLHDHPSEAVASVARQLTTQWKHALTLEKMSAKGGDGGEAAAFALKALSYGAGSGPSSAAPSNGRSVPTWHALGSDSGTGTSSVSGLPAVVPVSSLILTPTPDERRAGTLSESGLTAAHRQFESTGVISMLGVVPQSFLKHCVTDVDRCLDSLVTKLGEHGLGLHDNYDFEEVRQRPGGRVDSRYEVLDGPCGDPQLTQSRMLYPLLKKILNTDDPRLLWGGVVHAFGSKGRHQAATPSPPTHQVWHRDGPSLFGPWSDGHHHPSHCVNVFIPLVDVTKENGPTDFIPGSHVDSAFEAVLPEVLQAEKANVDQGNVCAPLLTAGSALIFDIRVLHRGRGNFSPTNRPMLYYTFATPWYTDLHMFNEKKSLVMSADLMALKAREESLVQFGAALRATVGQEVGVDDDKEGYGHPHYTERFDLLLVEAMATVPADGSRAVADAALRNAAAAIKFGTLSAEEKKGYMQRTVDAFGSSGTLHATKQAALRTLELERKAARQAGEESFVPAASFRGVRAGYSYKTGEEGLGYYRDAVAATTATDFGSVNDDMSVVSCLYRLLVQALGSLLGDLGFTQDMDGLLVWLVLAKASARASAALGEYRALLEDALTSWWHAGTGRFEMRSLSAGSSGETKGGTVIVVCSSLGTGVVRPEWSGTLRQLELDSIPGRVDVLHVMDPSATWWSQDPTCSWDGFAYYNREVATRVAGYDQVLVLGDSMGGGGALMLAPLAHRVLCFTPQLDLATYPAITRVDMDPARRATYKQQLEDTLRIAVAEKGVQIEVHYGDTCEEDCKQVAHLSALSLASEGGKGWLKLIPHEYHEHVLSMELRKRGVLVGLVQEWYSAGR